MHFISFVSDDLLLIFIFKDNIKKLKKQVKRIRALIHEKQFTDDLSALFFE
jgi:phosphotransferase system IIB component